MPWSKLFCVFSKTAKTLPVEATTSFTTMSLSPCGHILITGNECESLDDKLATGMIELLYIFCLIYY